MVTVEDISFSYSVRGIPRPVFSHFSAEFKRGQITAIIGPSGCGKTTLLRLIAGLQTPQEGKIRVETTTNTNRSDYRAIAAREPSPLRFGFIFQDFGLLPWLSVERNADLGLEALRVPLNARKQRVSGILEELGIAQWRNAYPVRLSGGMQQRVAVARALAIDAELILMDEPFSSLDALTRESVQDMLRAIQRAHHSTIVIVTHSIEEAVYLADEILILDGKAPAHKGRLVLNPHSWEKDKQNAKALHIPESEIKTLHPRNPRENSAYLEAVGTLRHVFDGEVSTVLAENAPSIAPQTERKTKEDQTSEPSIAPSISKFIKRMAQILGASIFLFILWWLVATILQKSFLPSPMLAFEKFFANIHRGIFALHVLASARRVFLALLFAGPLAWVLGILAGRISFFDNFFAPLIYLMHPLPKVAFLPLLMLFLGIGDASKIALMGLVIFGQLFVTGRDAAKSIPSALIDSVRVLGFSRVSIIRLVIVPSTTPSLMSALRVSLGTAIAVLFLSETFASTDGLGWYIMDAWSRIDYPDMYAAILALSLFGLVLYLLIDALEAYLLRWRQST